MRWPWHRKSRDADVIDAISRMAVHDPELPAAQIRVSRGLERADRALERRRRLDVELDRAVRRLRREGA